MVAMDDPAQASPLYKVGVGIQKPFGNIAPTLDSQPIRFQLVTGGSGGVLERVWHFITNAPTLDRHSAHHQSSTLRQRPLPVVLHLASQGDHALHSRLQKSFRQSADRQQRDVRFLGLQKRRCDGLHAARWDFLHHKQRQQRPILLVVTSGTRFRVPVPAIDGYYLACRGRERPLQHSQRSGLWFWPCFHAAELLGRSARLPSLIHRAVGTKNQPPFFKLSWTQIYQPAKQVRRFGSSARCFRKSGFIKSGNRIAAD